MLAVLRAGAGLIPREWVPALLWTTVGIGDLWADWGGGGAGALPERYPIKQSSELHDGAQEGEI